MPAFTHQLNLTARCTVTQRGEALRPLGICGGQVPYLLRLCRHPGQSQEELARALCLNKSTVARQITHLEKEGFVERRPSPEDRRRQLVYPSQRALDALPEIRRVVNDWNEYLLDGFAPEERALLQDMMAQLAERARAYIEKEVGWET